MPPPDEESARHSARVVEHLCDRIDAAGGSVSFAEYMQEILYAPGLGYYSAGARKFGAGGDFITAPEVSPLFGRVVAMQCAEVLRQTGGGYVLEPGAGTGSLAAAIIGRLAELDRLPDQYLILEVSPELQERQRETLRIAVPEHVDRIAWLSAWPQDFVGVVIANELLDALPVERFCKQGGAFLQARVALGNEGFEWRHAPAVGALERALADLEARLGGPLPDGYQSEISLGASGWIGDLAAHIQHGYAMLFDYGVARHEYYAPDRSGGWLRCHYRHRVHNDPLLLPGIQDVTAWVDFSRVADAARDAGMNVDGFVTQALFLVNGGLDKELAELADLPDSERLNLAQEIQMLTLPGQMGENFKCIGFGKGGIVTPPSFASANRVALLLDDQVA